MNSNSTFPVTKSRLQLRIQIERARGFHGVRDDVLVRQGSEFLLAAGNPLNVDRDDAFVGKHHAATHGLVGIDHFRAV